MAKPKRSSSSPVPPNLPPVAPNRVVSITAEELLQASGKVKVVDCRSRPERRLSAIVDAITYNPPRFEVENPRKVPIVCVSWFGRRSLVAAYRLAKQGFTVYNLQGGMFGWQKQGYPTVKNT